jgi:hypothetical protein
MFPVSKVHHGHLIHGPNRVSATIVSRFSQHAPFGKPVRDIAAVYQAASGANFCQATSRLAAQPHRVPRPPSSASSSASL